MEKRVSVLVVAETGAIATVRSSRVYRVGSRGGGARGDISSIVMIGDFGTEKRVGDIKKPFGIIITFHELLSVSYSAFRAVSYTF